ncbi:MAG: hypothetical protein WBG36_10075 [Ornithinimicrobium sp.]
MNTNSTVMKTTVSLQRWNPLARIAGARRVHGSTLNAVEAFNERHKPQSSLQASALHRGLARPRNINKAR